MSDSIEKRRIGRKGGHRAGEGRGGRGSQRRVKEEKRG